MFRTNFSQNFLKSSSLVEKLIRQTSIGPEDTVYDIGAGQGIISENLVKVVKQVVAIEPDAKYSQILKDKFQDVSNINIIPADFLKLDLPSKPFKVFSNIPFNITAEILSKLCFTQSGFTEGYFVMEYKATTKPMFSVLLNNVAKSRIVFDFEKTDYTPSPSVDTVLFHIEMKKPIMENIELFNDFIAFAFLQWQPTMEKVLQKIFTKPQVFRLIKDLKIEKSGTQKDITFSTWRALFNFYEKNQQIIPTKVKGSHKEQLQLQAKLKQTHNTKVSYN